MPALAARAPLGATQATTGTGEARMALIMLRIEVSRPPGVSICRMSRLWPSVAERWMPRTTWSALAGPMAPSMVMRPTAAGRAAVAGADAQAGVDGSTASSTASSAPSMATSVPAAEAGL